MDKQIDEDRNPFLAALWKINDFNCAARHIILVF